MSERIPVTAMVERYRALKEASQLQRLEDARRVAKDPRSLARDFAESVERFGEGFDSNEGFYPDGRKPLPAPGEIRSTVQVAAHLQRRGETAVLGGSELDFVYVDREIVPARTTSGAVFEDGKPVSTALRLDVLLANTHDMTPIVGEVKVAMDKDPYFALIQALTLAAHLVTPAQLRRLRRAYSRRSGFARGRRVDVYLLFARTPAAGTYWFELREEARRASEALMAEDQIRARIRRIAALDLDEVEGRLRVSRRFASPDA